MAVCHCRTQIPASHIHIVDQQAHPHSPVGCFEQLIRKQSADEVVMIQVILGIDAPFSYASQQRARHKSIQAITQKEKP